MVRTALNEETRMAPVSDNPYHQAILDRIYKIPIMTALSLTVETLSDGYCKLTMPRKNTYDGIYESVHGGILMTLADTAACFAILTQTDPTEILTTTDMNIRFLAPCLTDVVVEARVIKLGRTLCPTQTDIFDTKGRLVAIAQVTYMRLPQMPTR